MKEREKIIVTSLFVVTIAFAIYLIRSILTPFIISLILSYFLHPLVDRLCQKTRISRFLAVIAIVGLFFAIFFVVLSLILPIIYEQLSALISALPQYFQTLANDLYPRLAAFLISLGIKINSNFEQAFENADVAKHVLNFLQNFIANLFQSSVALVNVLSLIFITPILIFYFLKDWDVLVEKVLSFLPKKYSLSIKNILQEVDQALSGYVRGQINVCLILGIIYSISLTFIGLNFGFLIGFFTGIFSFVPYVGALSGFTIAIVLAMLQWGVDFTNLSLIVLVFLFCQTLESNYLTPKLIGNKVGLHPVWIIFGLFVFGSLFGFLGMLLSTPLSAICGVLIRNLALEYKKRIS